MRTKMLVIAALALGLGAGGALAKGGPPPKDPKGHGPPPSSAANPAKGEQEAAKDQKELEKGIARDAKQSELAAAKAAREAARELKFKRETKRLGFTCRPGTTHIEGVVVSVTPATDIAPGSIMIKVTKGNSRGKTLVGTQITITLLASTEVIRNGQASLAQLAVGDRVRLDSRSCTPPDADTTDGVAPAPTLVARKIFAAR